MSPSTCGCGCWPRRRKNVCCVGDDDQSIYGWARRGGGQHPALRARLSRRQGGPPRAQLPLHLAHTEAAASGLIATNKSRLGKTLWTDSDQGGEKVRVSGVWDGEAEAQAGGRRDRALEVKAPDLGEQGRQNSAATPNDAAMLVPRLLPDAGVRRAVRACCRSPTRWWAAHASSSAPRSATFTPTCASIQSEDDDLAFERIVNTPRARHRRYLGVKAAVARPPENGVLRHHRRRGGSDRHGRVAGAHPHGPLQLHPRPRSLDGPGSETTRHGDLTETILEGERVYRRPARSIVGPQSQGQARQPQGSWCNSMSASSRPCKAYLEHVSLVMDLDRESTATDAVWIMTLHSAKGLEFPLVFLPGWEEGVFPSQRSIDENRAKRGLEEERRLAYVGITRAREEARISFAANRLGLWAAGHPSCPRGSWTSCPPPNVAAAVGDRLLRRAARACRTSAKSRFDEAGPVFSGSVLQLPRLGSARRRARPPTGSSTRGRRAARRHPPAMIEGGRPPDRHLRPQGRRRLRPRRPRLPPEIRLREGDVGWEGSKLTVAFDKAGEKRVIDSFVEKAGLN